MLYGIKTDRMTQTKLNEANKIAGIQLRDEQICSRGWAFNNQSKQNDEEGSQSLSKNKIGEEKLRQQQVLLCKNMRVISYVLPYLLSSTSRAFYTVEKYPVR